jgi:hypothetical protein
VKQELITWLTPHLQALPTEAKALCLNLYESEEEGEFDAQLVACAAYDREDPDWACEDIFSTGEELFGFSSEDWEAALDLMLETMSEAIADGILPDAIEYVAVGFVDGDLEEVFCRE